MVCTGDGFNGGDDKGSGMTSCSGGFCFGGGWRRLDGGGYVDVCDATEEIFGFDMIPRESVVGSKIKLCVTSTEPFWPGCSLYRTQQGFMKPVAWHLWAHTVQWSTSR